MSSILSKNEVNRDDPYNRHIFVRVRHGRYILNPLLEIDVDGNWVNVYDLIGISELEQENRDNTYQARTLQAVLQFVRKRQAEAAASGSPETERSDDGTPDSRLSAYVEESF